MSGKEVTRMSGSAGRRDLCAATNSGLEMRAHHSLDTHRSRHRAFTGILERISKMTSFGRETGASPDGKRKGGSCSRRGRQHLNDEQVIPISSGFVSG
jgi:hypothetical protein